MKTEKEKYKKKIEKMGETIRYLNEVLSRKNRELDALHYVWCSGGCRSGVNRYSGIELTEETVKLAEANTSRLREWFENNKRYIKNE